MALEKADFTTISKFVRDSVQRLPPRPIKAVGIGRVLGAPETTTPPASDSSDRIATTAFVNSQGYVPSPSSIQTHDVPVWNGSSWVRPSGTPSSSVFLRGDGTWSASPASEIGYDQITATVNVTSTSDTAPTTIIAGSAHTFDGAPVIAEFFSPVVVTPSLAAGNLTGITLFEGASSLAVLAEIITPAAANTKVPVLLRFRFTPSAGSHTYGIGAWATNTTGTPAVVAGASGSGAFVPAYLRFTKV